MCKTMSLIQRRAQRHNHVTNGTLPIFDRGPMGEEFVIASRAGQGSKREEVDACGDGLTVSEGIFNL